MRCLLFSWSNEQRFVIIRDLDSAKCQWCLFSTSRSGKEELFLLEYNVNQQKFCPFRKMKKASKPETR